MTCGPEVLGSTLVEGSTVGVGSMIVVDGGSTFDDVVGDATFDVGCSMFSLIVVVRLFFESFLSGVFSWLIQFIVQSSY